jgi:hypothetical protein
MQPPSALDGVSLYVPTPENVAATAAPPHSRTHMWKDGESFGFHDLLDTLNPLQHIPLISTLYRWLTGDQPGNVAEIVGDGIYGGPLGLGAGLLTVALKEETGKSPGELALAALGVDVGATDVATAPQSAPTAAPAAAPPAADAAAAAPLPAPPVAGIPVAAASASAAAPLIPLQKSLPSPAPATSATGATGTAEQAFRAQRAAMQRSLYGTRPALPDHPMTQPIPLHLTAPVLPPPAPRPILIPANAVPAAAAPASAPLAPGAPLPGAALPNQPVDISQRMMDALDKYAKLQQGRQRGQQLDVAP